MLPLPPAGVETNDPNYFKKKRPYYFISYCWDDAKHVFPVVEELRKLKKRVWLDRERMPGGSMSLNEDIVKGMFNAEAILLFYSPAYESRRASCCKEQSYAFGFEFDDNELIRPVIALNLSGKKWFGSPDNELSLHLMGRHFLDPIQDGPTLTATRVILAHQNMLQRHDKVQPSPKELDDEDDKDVDDAAEEEDLAIPLRASSAQLDLRLEAEPTEEEKEATESVMAKLTERLNEISGIVDSALWYARLVNADRSGDTSGLKEHADNYNGSPAEFAWRAARLNITDPELLPTTLCIKYYITRYPELLERKFKGDTLLHLAIQADAVDIVRLLIPLVGVEQKGHFDNSPLHTAARWDKLEIIEILLSRFADAKALNKYKNTPLHSACYYGCLEPATLLLLHTDIEVQGKNRKTPLHSAAAKNHCFIIKMLLEKGANRGALTVKKKTPEMLAKFYKNTDAAELLHHYP